MNYYVTWYYIANYSGGSSDSSKPTVNHVENCKSIVEAIDRGVFYTSPEFYAKAWFLVWSDDNPTPWVGKFAEAKELYRAECN